MKKMMHILACSSLLLFQSHGKEQIKVSKVNAITSQTGSATQDKEENASLGAFEALHWETDMDDAFARAQKEHKDVMVMVEEKHCKWCKKMKKGALSDREVQDKLQSYILLKVKRSDKKTAKRIEAFTGAIPSFYFMQPDKEMIDSVIGYFVTEDFVGYLDEIAEEQ